MREQTRAKIYLALDIVVIGCAVLNILLWVFPRPELEPSWNTHDFRGREELGVAGVNVTWMGMPLSNVTVEIQNEEFKTIHFTKTDERGFAKIDLSRFDNRTYYLKIITTVHFVEGGAETRYLYWIFVCNTKSDITVIWNVNFAPKIWEEEPTITIKQ